MPVRLPFRLTSALLALGLAGTAGAFGNAGPALADDLQPSIVESHDYPDADRIFQERNIRLIKGDGNIVLTECTGTGLIEVWSTQHADEFCFKTRGLGGYLALELQDVYLIKGNDRNTSATVTVDNKSETKALPANEWVPVGVGAEQNAAALVELKFSTTTTTAGDGTPATYPFIAKVSVNNTLMLDGVTNFRMQTCTGVLVDPQWVATSPSCFTQSSGGLGLRATVTLGRADLYATGTGHEIRVVETVRHPERNLLLARLAQPVTDVRPVAIGTTPPQAGETLRIAGYGRTATEWMPAQPHAANFAVDAVADAALTITPSASDGLLCKGDAGGPALRERDGAVELVALHDTAWQGGCVAETEQRKGGTEVRVDNLKDWIRQQVNGDRFVPLTTPVKVLDTKTSGVLGPQSTRNFSVTGVGAVPQTGVSAVQLRLTTSGATASTWLGLWPFGTSRPGTSAMNPGVGEAESNLVTVPVGTNGWVSIFNNAGNVAVVAEVRGYFTTGADTGGFTPVAHTRPVAVQTVGQSASVTLKLTGGIIPTGAQAALLDVSISGTENDGQLSVFPVGNEAARSLINWGAPRGSAPALVPLPADGRVTFKNNTTEAIVLSVTAEGYASASAGVGFRSVTGRRIIDTRAGGAKPVPANGIVDVPVGLPAGTNAALLNLTVVGNTTGGDLKVWPTGGTEPAAPVAAYQIIESGARATMAAVKVGADGKVRVKNTSTGTVHFFIDVQGYFTDPLLP
ncbi:trypsin-like serine protease [Actinomycetes bacterium KLBMP 9797]